MLINRTLFAIILMIFGALVLAIQNSIVKFLSAIYPIWEIKYD